MQDKSLLVGLGVAAIVIAVLVFFYFRGAFGSFLPSLGAMQAPQDVPFTKVVEGVESPVETRVNYLIKTQDELAELWQYLNAPGTPPAIDFNTNAVAAVFAGAEPTQGYVIQVSKVEDAAKRKVMVTIQKPTGACAIGSSTAPYELISFPKTTLALDHEDVLTDAPCGQ